VVVLIAINTSFPLHWVSQNKKRYVALWKKRWMVRCISHCL